MRRAIAHVHLHWLVQLAAAVAATLVGAMFLWTAWPILIGLLVALAAAARFAWRDLETPRIALGACVVGQLPGLLLSLLVAAGFARVLAEPYASMAWLEAWTIAWTPVWSLLPDTTFHRRGLYVWLIPLLPWLQLALTLGLSRALPHADSRG